MLQLGASVEERGSAISWLRRPATFTGACPALPCLVASSTNRQTDRQTRVFWAQVDEDGSQSKTDAGGASRAAGGGGGGNNSHLGTERASE